MGRAAEAGGFLQAERGAWRVGGPSATLPPPALSHLVQGRGRDGGILYAWAERRIAAYLEVLPFFSIVVVC